MRIHSIMLGAAALGLGSTTASAQTVFVDANRLPSERVSFADLNLGSAAGKATLEQRIRGAARRLCVANGVRNLEEHLVGRTCYAAAIADGRRQMNQVIASGQFGIGIATATLTIRGQ